MRPTVLFAAIPVALLASAALVAQPKMPTEAPGKPDPAAVSGGTYAVDPGHTQVVFAWNHMGLTTNMGLIAGPSTGSLTIDPKVPTAAKVLVSFPVANIKSGVPALDEHLMKAEFFDAAKYPTATFESTDVKVSGTTATLTGNLTIKGVTKPVTLAVAFQGVGPNPMTKKQNIGFSATGKIKRSDFNMSYGVPLVGDEIELKIAAGFEKS